MTVDGRGGPARPVSLPANLDGSLPREDLTFRLRTQVHVPPELADRRLRLVLPSADARVTLLADGAPVDEE